ncbi:hypothetical protein K431DRAFT_291962 [Polychaeton citri CBS 116435]|uniref:Uncharacterized protein n=1 Tax=Polychaeton citri CBS 116435 TaxID=1314669 RepID=A0A9P4QG25_9PEZI|nr:hypothetical protein K431DRAFT_291962 [Polychaeton citri CBS 116435]
MEIKAHSIGRRPPFVVERALAEPYEKSFAESQIERLIKQSGFTVWETEVVHRMAIMIRSLDTIMFPPSRPPAIWCLDSETDSVFVATVHWFIDCLIEGRNYWEGTLSRQLDDALQAKIYLPPLSVALDTEPAVISGLMQLWAIRLRFMGERISTNKIALFKHLYDHFHGNIWRQLSVLVEIEPNHPLTAFRRLLLPIHDGLGRLIDLLRDLEYVVGLLQREYDRCADRHQIYITLPGDAPEISHHTTGFIGWYVHKIDAKEEAKRKAKNRQRDMMNELPTFESTNIHFSERSVEYRGPDRNSNTSGSFSTIADAASTFGASKQPDWSKAASSINGDIYRASATEMRRADGLEYSQEGMVCDQLCEAVEQYQSDRPSSASITASHPAPAGQPCSRSQTSVRQLKGPLHDATVVAEVLPCVHHSSPSCQDLIQPNQPITTISDRVTDQAELHSVITSGISNNKTQEFCTFAPSKSADEEPTSSLYRSNAKEVSRITTGSCSEIKNKLAGMQLGHNKQVSICSSGLCVPGDEVRIRGFANAPASPLNSALPSPTTLLRRSNAQSCNTFEWEQRMLNGEIVRYRRPERGRGRASTIDDRTVDREEWLAKSRAGERMNDLLTPLQRKYTI